MKFQTVRGMRDFLPEQAAKKQAVEQACRRVFERFGFAPMETPVVEEFALLGKKGGAGEAIRDEIYYFKDKGNRELGLRFDLTVPLARVVASNPQIPKPFKRYQTGRVYRYDRPGASRYREFTQSDWDIVGSGSMAADFEVIAVAIAVMQELGFRKGEFIVKVNSRKLLEEIALCCGVAPGKVVECFRCLDKLEKQGEETVRKELGAKGINAQILGQLKTSKLSGVKVKDTAPLEELKQLLGMLKENGLSAFVEVDLCLARGLEYYTGMVFEVCVKGSPSVGGGGRYDKLVELYGGAPTPAVGGSFGVDRLLEAAGGKVKAAGGTKIFVAAVGKELQPAALKLVQGIRGLGISAAMDLNARGISKNLEYANKLGIPFVAILGEKELKKKEFTLKEMRSGRERKVKVADLKQLVNLK